MGKGRGAMFVEGNFGVYVRFGGESNKYMLLMSKSAPKTILFLLTVLSLLFLPSLQECSTIDNCLTCDDDPAVCSECNHPYSEDSNACSCLAPFTIDNGLCVCQTGTHTEVGTNCFLCNVTDCSACSAPSFCSTCLHNYQESSGDCVCAEGLVVAGGTAQGCVGCVSPHCIQCEAESYTCTQCNAPYEAEGGTCICPTSTHTQSGQNCFLCNVQNCASCTANSVCGTCADGYKFNSAQTQCFECAMDHCVHCSANGVCQECQSNYGAVEGACQCGEGLVESTLGGDCPACVPQYCAGCDANQECTSCNPAGLVVSQNKKSCICPQGETFHNNDCHICTGYPNCKTCSGQNICAECNQGYKFNDATTPTSCFQCNIQNCLHCSENGVCSQCEGGFVPVNDGAACGCPEGKQFASQEAVAQGCSGCVSINCGECDTQPQTCSACSSRFTFKDDDQTCAECPFTLLQGGTICDCAETEKFNPTSEQCISCTSLNCKYCSAENVCAECIQGFKFNANVAQATFCSKCSITQCQTCSSNNVCSSCTSPKVPSHDRTACVLCSTVPNCAFCSQDNVCEVCQPGYKRVNFQCIKCDVPFCDSCSANDVCSECIDSYKINTENQCQSCGYPCATCQTGTSKCETCFSPYSQNALTNGTCYKCNVPFCKQCQADKLSECTLCSEGYDLNSQTKKCSAKCSANCVQCTTEGVCEQCSNGYFIKDGACDKCGFGCSVCDPANPQTCTTCSSGYFLNAGLCTVCPSNCATCDNKDTCLTFKPETGHIPIEIDGVTYPTVCDPNCVSCSSQNPSICTTCVSGFSLSADNLCTPCAPECKTCSSTPATCTSCYSNAFLDTTGNTCNQCTSASNCLTCAQTNLAVCLSCPNGFVLETNICKSIQCSHGCLSCSSSAAGGTLCNTCKQGYALNTQGQCVPCLSHCRHCSPHSPGLCLDCGRKFYPLGNSNGFTCVACSDNCESCNELGCNICSSGYTLTGGVCTPVCSYPCATCDANNAQSCTSCLAGFTFNLGTKSCDKSPCTNGLCQVCAFGTVNRGTECTKCTAENCARCSAVTLSQCTVCQDGFYLTETNTCSACPEGAATCSSATFALSCASGFTSVPQLEAFGVVQCNKCQSPCLTCTSDPENCDTCVEGYYLEGWKCVTTFNFNFEVTLQTTLENFYSKYLAFIDALVGLIQGANRNSITLKQIQTPNAARRLLSVVSQTPGTVTVAGSVSTTAESGSDEATAQYNNLMSGLATGSLIEGMPVASSSITVIGGDLKPIDEKKGPNVPLILGLTIGLGVPALLLIAFIIYKKVYVPRVNAGGLESEEEFSKGAFKPRE